MHDGDTFEHKGQTFRVQFEHDGTHGAPWEEEEGHGPVRKSRIGYSGRPAKAPNERVLWSDRHSALLYDFAEAVRIAKRDGWGAPPFKTGTKGERAVRAVEADFKRLKYWCNDEWSYVGVIVHLLDDDGASIESASLWGVESDAGEYIAEVAKELADEILLNVCV